MRTGIRPTLLIHLTPKDRAFLEERCRRRTAPYREVIKAKALLMADDGLRNVQIAAHVLAPNSFPSPQAVMERILRYIHFYNLNAKPIEWVYTSNDPRRKYNVVEMTPSEESSAGTREMGKVA